MAKKLPPKFGHDWDQHVYKQEKRERILRGVLVSVLGAALLGTLYLGAVVLMNRDDPAVVDGPVASTPIPGREPAPEDGEGAPGVPGNGPMDEPPGEATVDPEGEDGPPDPAGEEPVAAETPGEAPPDSPPPVSPLFANELVDNDLDYIDLGEEGNLLQLFVNYAGALEEKRGREQLQEIYELLREKKTGEALGKVDELEAPARVREGARAMVLTRMLRKEEAGRAFLEANRYAQPAEFHFEYGFYHLAARALGEAYAQFRTGVRKNPQSPSMRFVAAGTAFDLKKWGEVIEHVSAAEELVEKVPPKLGLLAALAEARTGQPQAAVDRSRRLLETHPDNADVKLFLARALGALGKLDESLEIYSELKSELPDAALIKIEMTRAYMASDQKEKALDVAAELAGAKPDDVRIQAWYADILAANGKVEEAAAILEGLSDDLKGNEMAVLRSLLALRQEDYAGASAALEPYHT
ncbi:MAG: tetratricopeptide repeat protein, partial [Akkermansiaceae bacterium]|nr:tetratricopeptide repeat protein [Akkermansiaceae bacterium]